MKHFFTSIYIMIVDAMILSFWITGIQFLVEKTGKYEFWVLVIFVVVAVVLNTGYLVYNLIDKE